MPEAYKQFLDIATKLEKHYHDMQDVEFTIERGKLWMLQTRNGKRTAQAAVKIAVDMANEGLITKEEAVLRVTPDQVDTLLHPQFDAEDQGRSQEATAAICAKGVNASPGAAVGQVYLRCRHRRDEWPRKSKQDVIMVRPFTKPDDVHGMLAAKGILTSEGGATSHAAVVARQFGVPCVVGASDSPASIWTSARWKPMAWSSKKATGFRGWHHRRGLTWARCPDRGPQPGRTDRPADPAELGR